MVERVVTEEEIKQFLTGMTKTIRESVFICSVMAEVKLLEGVEVDWEKAGENFGWALANYAYDTCDGKIYPVLTLESILAVIHDIKTVSIRESVYKEYGIDPEVDEPTLLGKIWFQEYINELLPSD